MPEDDDVFTAIANDWIKDDISDSFEPEAARMILDMTPDQFERHLADKTARAMERIAWKLHDEEVRKIMEGDGSPVPRSTLHAETGEYTVRMTAAEHDEWLKLLASRHTVQPELIGEPSGCNYAAAKAAESDRDARQQDRETDRYGVPDRPDEVTGLERMAQVEVDRLL